MGRQDYVPFVTRILVRQDRRRKWIAAVFAGCSNNGGVCIVGSEEVYKHCVLYAGNESILNLVIDPKDPNFKPERGTLVAVSTDGEHWYPGLFERYYGGCYPDNMYFTTHPGGNTHRWKYCDKFDKHFNVPVTEDTGSIL